MIYDLRFTRLRQATARQAIYTLASSFVICHSSFGQGALTPPGAPGPTMLTLSQIEPRTPVDAAHTPGTGSGTFTITNPGSYYLTANVVAASGAHGITIATNNVTLDLNGFTISSSSGSGGSGIWITGNGDITIFNGHIKSGVTNNGSGVYSGPGFYYGISASAQNVLVRGVTVSGVLINGIYLDTGNSTVVESCEVRTAGSYGIFASTVKSSSALDIGSTALVGDQVADCYGQSTATGDGIHATVVQNSYGYSLNNTAGIYAYSALNCYGYNGGGGDGIQVIISAKNCYGYNTGGGYGIGYGGGDSTVESCQGYSGSGTGIKADTVQNCYGSSATGTAVDAEVALNCQGYVSGSGAGTLTFGVHATTAENCFGQNFGSGFGIYAVVAALNCDGFSFSGTGLSAFIANGSHGSTLSYTHNVNSF